MVDASLSAPVRHSEDRTDPDGMEAISRNARMVDPEDVRRGIELIYFGYANMIRGPDAILARRRLGRAHHRALYFIARKPGLAVSDLLKLLAITKQSLSRVLADLIRLELVEQKVGATDRRQRLLRLTEAGARLEAELFDALFQRMADAYRAAGKDDEAGFMAILSALVAPGDLAMLEKLNRPSGRPDQN